MQDMLKTVIKEFCKSVYRKLELRFSELAAPKFLVQILP